MPEPNNGAPTTKEQIEEVKAATDRFRPARILPVNIDFSAGSDPYELAQEVLYDNDIVKVKLDQGFKWDGASIPTWLPILPWLLTLLAMQFYQSPWLWPAVGVMVLYTLRLLPYMQKMGIHARAACVHDKLYRAQSVNRLISDAIFDSIMESDGVPWDVRWLIHGRLRHFGWIAWNQNRRALPAKREAKKDVEVNQESALAHPTEPSPANTDAAIEKLKDTIDKRSQ